MLQNKPTGIGNVNFVHGRGLQYVNIANPIKRGYSLTQTFLENRLMSTLYTIYSHDEFLNNHFPAEASLGVRPMVTDITMHCMYCVSPVEVVRCTSD